MLDRPVIERKKKERSIWKSISVSVSLVVFGCVILYMSVNMQKCEWELSIFSELQKNYVGFTFKNIFTQKFQINLTNNNKKTESYTLN